MANDTSLRKHVLNLLGGGQAHLTFEAAVKNVPVALRGKRPKGVEHSPWEILEHMRIAQADILDFCLNPNPFQTGRQEIPVSQRLIMNFYTAKRLCSALAMTLQRHEGTFGNIELDVDYAAATLCTPYPGTGIAHDVVVNVKIPECLEHIKGKNIEMQAGSLGPTESRELRLGLSAINGGEAVILVEARRRTAVRVDRAKIRRIASPGDSFLQ
jgi:hypothetical protein